MKVVSEFLFWHQKVPFFVPENGHFCQKCPPLRAQKWHFGCPNESSETTCISPTSPKNGEFDFSSKHLPLLDGFSANSKYAKQSYPWQKGCLGPKWRFWPLGGPEMAQVCFKGLNIGRTIKAECLVLLLMFLKHLGALFGCSPSKEIFCHYTNTVEGSKSYPSPEPSPP